MHRLVAQRIGLLSDLVTRNSRGAWRMSIDHVNGDKLDNRRSNLRLGDRPRQMRNPSDRLRRTNTSGFRGVTFDGVSKRRKRWAAGVMVHGRHINLGYFTTAEEAADARRTWDEQHPS
jgi:hypothetical protein